MRKVFKSFQIVFVMKYPPTVEEFLERNKDLLDRVRTENAYSAFREEIASFHIWLAEQLEFDHVYSQTQISSLIEYYCEYVVPSRYLSKMYKKFTTGENPAASSPLTDIVECDGVLQSLSFGDFRNFIKKPEDLAKKEKQ